MDWKSFLKNNAGSLAQFGAGGAELFGWDNPADAAMGDLDKIPGLLQQYYSPYMKAGEQSLGNLQGQYGQLLGNPGQRLNQIGSEYQQSPGFQFAKDQGLQAVNNASAAGGMAGTPQHGQQAAGFVEGLANQDYNNWMQHALGLYGQGLAGEQDLSHLGFGATDSSTQSLINSLLSKASLKYAGADAANKNRGGGIGSILQAGAQFLPAFL
jgi:hypothetical protein